VILLWVAAIFAGALRWLKSLAEIPTPRRLWTQRIEAAS
jgi:hypothetical protein